MVNWVFARGFPLVKSFGAVIRGRIGGAHRKRRRCNLARSQTRWSAFDSIWGCSSLLSQQVASTAPDEIKKYAQNTFLKSTSRKWSFFSQFEVLIYSFHFDVAPRINFGTYIKFGISFRRATWEFRARIALIYGCSCALARFMYMCASPRGMLCVLESHSQRRARSGNG